MSIAGCATHFIFGDKTPHKVSRKHLFRSTSTFFQKTFRDTWKTKSGDAIFAPLLKEGPFV